MVAVNKRMDSQYAGVERGDGSLTVDDAHRI